MDSYVRKVYRYGVTVILTLMLATPVFGESVYIPVKTFTPTKQTVKVVDRKDIIQVDGKYILKSESGDIPISTIISGDDSPIALIDMENQPVDKPINVFPVVIVENVGEDCFDLNPEYIQCTTEECCHEVATRLGKGVEYIREDDISDEEIQSVGLNWRYNRYAQSVVNLSNKIQIVMLTNSYTDGERRAAVKLLLDNHNEYVNKLFNK